MNQQQQNNRFYDQSPSMKRFHDRTESTNEKSSKSRSISRVARRAISERRTTQLVSFNSTQQRVFRAEKEEAVYAQPLPRRAHSLHSTNRRGWDGHVGMDQPVIAKAASSFDVHEVPNIPVGFVSKRRALFSASETPNFHRSDIKMDQMLTERKSYIVVKASQDRPNLVSTPIIAAPSIHSGRISRLSPPPQSSLQSSPLSMVMRSDHEIDPPSTSIHTPQTHPSAVVTTIPIAIGKPVRTQVTPQTIRPKVDVVRIGVTPIKVEKRKDGRKSANQEMAKHEYGEDRKEWIAELKRDFAPPLGPSNRNWIDSEAQKLVIELETAKNTNKKLYAELARIERERRELEIEKGLGDAKAQALVASKMADAIQRMKTPRNDLQTEIVYQEPQTSTYSSTSAVQSPDFVQQNETLKRRKLQNRVEIEEKLKETRKQLSQKSHSSTNAPLEERFIYEDLPEFRDSNTISPETPNEGKNRQEKLRKENVDLRGEMAELRAALENSTILLDQINSAVRFSKRSSSPTHESLGSSISDENELHEMSAHSTEATTLRHQITIHEQSLKNKELLIARLERDLVDAQSCNQKLNAQMGSLATNGAATIKKEIVELKKELKDRTNEVETLKKRVQKADKDRIQWETQKKQLESRLPADVQSLMAEKRDLAQQLDRQENEQQELFMQLNSLIGQLAESQSENERLSGERDQFKRQASDAEASSSKENQRKIEDLQRRLQQDLELQKNTFEIEKKSLVNEKRELEKEIELKSAALQSLMLAKEPAKVDTSQIQKLAEEKGRLEQEVQDLQWRLDKQTKEAETEVLSLKKQLADFTAKLEVTNRERLEIEEKLKREEREALESRTRITRDFEDSKRENGELLAKLAQLNSLLDHAKTDMREAETKLRREATDSEVESKKKSDEWRDRVKSVEDKNGELVAKLALLTTQLDQTRAESRELESKLRREATESDMDAQRKVDEWRDRLQTAEDRVAALEIEASAAKKEAENVLEIANKTERAEEARATDLQIDLTEKSEKLEKHEKTIRELQHELESLRSKEATLHSEVQRLHEKLEIMQKHSNERDQEVESYRTRVNSLESQLEIAEAEGQTARALAETEARRALSLQKQLETQSGSQTEQVTLLREQLVAGETREKEIEVKHQEQHLQLQEQIRELKSKVETQCDHLKGLEGKLSEAQAEVQRRNERVEEIQKMVDGKQHEITDLQGRLDELRRKAGDDAGKIRALEREKAELEAEKKKLEAKASVADELKTLMTSLQSARHENSELQSEITTLHQELRSARDEIDRLESECLDWKNRAEVAEGERENERERLELLTTAQTSEQDKLTELLAEKKRLEDEMRDERKRLNDESVAKLVEATEKCRKETEEKVLIEKRRLEDEATARLKEAEEKALAEKRKLENDAAVRLSTLQEKYDALEQEAETSRGQIKQFEEEKEKSSQNLDDEKHRLEEDNRELQESVRRLVTQREERDRRIDELETRLDMTEKEHSEIKSTLTTSEDSLMALRSAADASRQQMKEAEDFGIQIKKQLEELDAEHRRNVDEVERRHQEKEKALTERIESLTAQTTELLALEAQISTLKNDVDSSKRSLAEEKDKTNRLEAEIDAKETKLEELREKIAQPAENPELVAENTRLANEVAKLEGFVERLRKEVTQNNNTKESEGKLSKLEEQLEELKTQQRRKERDAEMLREEIEQAHREADSARSDYSVLNSKLRAVESERNRLAQDLEEARNRATNGKTSPPVGSRLTRTVSNMSRMSYSESIMQCDDPDKLKTELERQHRLIVVLRRKLQKEKEKDQA